MSYKLFLVKYDDLDVLKACLRRNFFEAMEIDATGTLVQEYVIKKQALPDKIVFKDLVLNTKRNTLYKNGKEIALSPQMYKLIELFMSHQGILFARDTIKEYLYGYDYFQGDRSIDVYVGYLRRKLLEKNEEYIKTKKGFGYIME